MTPDELSLIRRIQCAVDYKYDTLELSREEIKVLRWMLVASQGFNDKEAERWEKRFKGETK